MTDQHPPQDDNTTTHNNNTHRPSFVSFWKKGKELALGQGRKKKEVKFVEAGGSAVGSGGEQSSDNQGNDGSGVPESKAAHRRAQVRRAQIQHRQRKANYVKELEQEVAKIRKQIEDVDKERRVLRVENEGMKAELRLRNGVSFPGPQPAPPQQQQGVAGPWYMSEKMNFTMTMQLGYDEVLGAPCYMVSGLSSPGFEAVTKATTAATAIPNSSILPTPPTTATFAPASSSSITTPTKNPITNTPDHPPELPYMTPPQIQTAINFILALEHTCRTHFHPSHFSPSTSSPVTTPPFHSSQGHSLTATSLALSSAPSSIFTAAKRTQLFPGSGINLKPSSSGTESLEWENSALTLKNLYRLSKVLEKEGEDRTEITPVQAWFEILAKYGVERVMGRVERLKGELGGRRVVRCPHFGARVDRGEWEVVVEGVMR